KDVIDIETKVLENNERSDTSMDDLLKQFEAMKIMIVKANNTKHVVSSYSTGTSRERPRQCIWCLGGYLKDIHECIFEYMDRIRVPPNWREGGMQKVVKAQVGIISGTIDGKLNKENRWGM
ncbi:hypothetical protein HK096_000901, partial [Nowakowskiella sp. JEL0078]